MLPRCRNVRDRCRYLPQSRTCEGAEESLLQARILGSVHQAEAGNIMIQTNSDALISASHLTKRYKDVVALDDVSFSIHDGITGILGENGAGKSTAIKIFLGLLQPTSGSVTVLGQDASKDLGVRGRLGYMPEHDCLPSGVSAAEFLMHMAELSGLPPSA